MITLSAVSFWVLGFLAVASLVLSVICLAVTMEALRRLERLEMRRQIDDEHRDLSKSVGAALRESTQAHQAFDHRFGGSINLPHVPDEWKAGDR